MEPAPSVKFLNLVACPMNTGFVQPVSNVSHVAAEYGKLQPCCCARFVHFEQSSVANEHETAAAESNAMIPVDNAAI